MNCMNPTKSDIKYAAIIFVLAILGNVSFAIRDGMFIEKITNFINITF